MVPIDENVLNIFNKDVVENKKEKSLFVASGSILANKVKKVNFDTFIFDELATNILKQAGYNDVKLLSRKSQELIIEDLLHQLGEKNGLNYFQKIYNKKGFVKSITSLLGQLARIDVTSDDLRRILSENWEGRGEKYKLKDAEVVAVYHLYRNYLETKGYYDVEGLYRLAIHALESDEANLDVERIYFFGFYNFDNLQVQLLEALSKKYEVVVGLVYEKNRTEIFASQDKLYTKLVAFADAEFIKERYVPRRKLLINLCDKLESQGKISYLQDLNNPAVQVWCTDNKESEMSLTLRLIKDKALRGEKLSEMAIIVRNIEDYSGIRHFCDEYGIPTTIAHSVPLHNNPVCELFIGLLKCNVGNQLDAIEAINSFFRLPIQEVFIGIDYKNVEHLRNTKYYDSAKSFLKDIQRNVADNNHIFAKLDELKKNQSVESYITKLSELVDSLDLVRKIGTAYKLKKINMLALKNGLEGIKGLQIVWNNILRDYQACGFSKKTISVEKFSTIFETYCAEATINLKRGNIDGLKVLSATVLEETFVKHAFILGVRENEFPKIQNENWIYNDKERAELNILDLELPGTFTALAEDAYFWGKAVSCATESINFTYYNDDRGGISRYLTSILELLSEVVKPVDTTNKLDTLRSKTEFINYVASNSDKDTLEDLLGEGKISAALIDSYRYSSFNGIYNGSVNDSKLREKIVARIGNKFSATGLDKYTKCPFAYLANNVWGCGTNQETDESIDALGIGNLVHEVLERFIGNHLGEKISTLDKEILLKELLEIFELTCEEHIKKGKIYDGPFWNSDKKRIERMLKRYLESEIRYSKDWNFTPYAVEKRFGDNDNPLEIEVAGEKIKLRGVIDRVDSLNEKYFVTDYKTGGIPNNKLETGENFQLAIYFMALVDMLSKENIKGDVVGGGYYGLKESKRDGSFCVEEAEDLLKSIGAKMKKQEDSDENLSMDEVIKLYTDVIGNIVKDIRLGRFNPVGDGKACSYCQMIDICRGVKVNED